MFPRIRYVWSRLDSCIRLCPIVNFNTGNNMFDFLLVDEPELTLLGKFMFSVVKL